MREIKFRQKLKPEYVQGGDVFHYWGYIDGGFVSPVGKNYCDTPDEQYTGLKDKNGVEFCEGDIVEKPDDKFCSVGAIKMKNGCWMVVASESHYLNLHWYSSEVRVIGNIHQHPTLLGDKI